MIISRVHSIFILTFFISVSFSVRAQEQLFLTIRKIEFRGNVKTREFVIRREMNIREGDRIAKDDILNVLELNRTRIMNVKLFADCHYSYDTVGDQIDILYDVKELFYWKAHPYIQLADRNFNVWWVQQHRSLNRINVGVDVDKINFRGRNEELGGEFQMGYNKHVYLYYVNPYIDATLKRGMKAIASYSTGKEIQFASDSNRQHFYRNETENPYRRIRGELTYLFRPAYSKVHELTLGFYHWRISDSLHRMQPDFLGGGKKLFYPLLKYQFRFNNTDDRNYPERGWVLDVYYLNNGLWLNPAFGQQVFYVNMINYAPLLNRLSISNQFRGRLAFSDDQPYFNNRALGFTNDFVRGYEYYVIDGTHFGIFRTDIRYKVFDIFIDQHIVPVLQHEPVKLFVKAYNDLGYVYSGRDLNSFLNNRWLHGYGAGLDIILSYYLKLRVEYSFNHFGEKGLFLHGRNE